jgi:hypothetical protein
VNRAPEVPKRQVPERGVRDERDGISHAHLSKVGEIRCLLNLDGFLMIAKTLYNYIIFLIVNSYVPLAEVGGGVWRLM